MKNTDVRREYQVVAGEETYENKMYVVYGIVMTEWRKGEMTTEQISSISTDLKIISELTERLRDGEVEMVHFKDIVIDYIAEL